MENKDRTFNQGGQGQGNKPGQGGQQQGRGEGLGGDRKPGQGGQQQGGGRERQGGSDKPTTRPSPSGVPNESRGTDDRHGSVDQGVRPGRGDNEYQGGRQRPGEIPNTDEQGDRGSVTGFRGTAGEEFGADEDEDGDEGLGAGVKRDQDSIRTRRQSDPSPNQRRVLPSEDETT